MDQSERVVRRPRGAGEEVIALVNHAVSGPNAGGWSVRTVYGNNRHDHWEHLRGQYDGRRGNARFRTRTLAYDLAVGADSRSGRWRGRRRLDALGQHPV